MRASNLNTVSTKLQRIAELARKAPTMVMTTLAHHIDREFLREAYHRTRKDGATGVDEQTGEEYRKNLDENLESLLNRLKSGSYKAPAVRRVYIPKPGDSKGRPIGVPTFEDKVLQRAITMLLEAVYEQDFLDCSYGFRPGRSAHQALETMWQGLMRMGGGDVLEVDIKSYFDTINHGQLRSILNQRVRDGVVRRMIDKWLKAGVMEKGSIKYQEDGTPQGGVISPMLANIYLHEVLDVWFEKMIKPRLKGQAFLIRYADDAVMVFFQAEDAKRVMSVIAKRFSKYGLTLHPEKTRLIQYKRPSRIAERAKNRRDYWPGSFNLLGFTHYWGRSRKGSWVVKRKTAKERLNRSLQEIQAWCQEHRHANLGWQCQQLAMKVKGHYAYYGITDNSVSLKKYYRGVTRSWKKWLSRRSQRAWVSWDQFHRLLEKYRLPWPKIVHSYVT